MPTASERPQMPEDPRADPAATVDALEDKVFDGSPPSTAGGVDDEDTDGALEQDLDLENLPGAGGDAATPPEPPA